MSNYRKPAALMAWVALLSVVFAVPLPGGAPRHAAAETTDPAANSPRGAMALLYSFSGVTDDGEKGGAERKEATSILCTNLSTVDTTIEVRIFQWSGALVDSRIVTAGSNRTLTFSTQNTTIYFDDLIFGTSSGGTDEIFQGHGQVWTDLTNVICTVQILDPLGCPPQFMDKLTLYTAAGLPVTADPPSLIFSDGFES